MDVNKKKNKKKRIREVKSDDSGDDDNDEDDDVDVNSCSDLEEDLLFFVNRKVKNVKDKVKKELNS